MSEIDFNKLIKDIVGVARGEATTDLSGAQPFDDDNKLSITLKLEVTVNKNSTQFSQASQKGSRKLVLLTLND